jgi:hypothetical protein
MMRLHRLAAPRSATVIAPAGQAPSRVPSAVRRLAQAAVALVAIAATAAGGGAQVVYSGPLNRAIPATNAGLNQNVVTGSFFTGPGSFPSCPGAGCNYDFSLFGTGSISSFFMPGGSGQTSPVLLEQRGVVAATATGNAIALAPGTLIGSPSIFNPLSSNTAAFLGGTDRIFGFRFRNEEGGANTLHYGWARITLPTTGDGVLIDHAYNATPGAAIAAGDMGGPAAVVPEPSTYVLVGTGLATLGAVARRRARAV